MPEIVVASIEARRRLEGVEISIKSPSVERLMRFLSDGAIKNPPARPRPRARPAGEEEPSTSAPTIEWTGASRIYDVGLVENGIPRKMVGFNLGRFDMWGSAELITARGPRFNLSPLLAVGTGNADGAVITIPTVASDKQLTEYLEGVKTALQQIYVDYLAERTHRIKITTEHMMD